MNEPVFDVLIKKCEAEQASFEQTVISGAAQDYAQYRELCGLIRGLETAKREIKDLAKNYMEDDDDDD